jgi:hypothetical protein
VQQVSTLDRRINGAKAGLAGENDQFSINEQIQQQQKKNNNCGL